MADDSEGQRDRKHHPGQRASDNSILVRLTTSDTGRWLLGLYRGGVLAGIVYASVAWAELQAGVDEFMGLRVAEQLATIRTQVADVQRRLTRIEFWQDGGGPNP